MGSPSARPISYDSTTKPASQKTTSKKKPRVPASDKAATNVEPAVEKPVVNPAPVATPVVVAPTPEEPTVAEQAHSLFSADPQRVLNFYKSLFDENDDRLNKLEISFAPMLINNESQSNYSFRDYSSDFTGVGLGANVWLTPALGLGGNFVFSLGADTSGDAVTQTRTPIRYEMLDVGLKYRKFFGFSSLSKSIEFDLLYADSRMIVPTDDLYRAGLKTSGLGVKMTVRIPSSADISWLVGGSFYPKLQHAELATGADFSSGMNTDNSRIGVQLGTEFKLSRQSQVFAEISAFTEKNTFSGPASIPDPATGLIPKNVNVSDAFYMFSFGYRWGN